MGSRERSRPSPEQAYEALEEVGLIFRDAADSLAEAQQMRDAAIILSSEQGLSRRKVAAAAGVTVGRVQQVLSGTDSRGRSDLSKRLIQAAANRLPDEERERYLEEWQAEIEAARLRPMERLAFALSLLRGSSALSKALGSDSRSQRRVVEKEGS